jgi:hypothetical protein
VFIVHESSNNNNNLRDEKRLQRSPTPQSFQPSQSEQGNEKELIDQILKVVMEELQEEPNFEEIHGIEIPFESKQHEESFPSFELPNDFQSLRILIEMCNFWVEQHMQVTPRVRPLPWGSTCTRTQLLLHSQTPSPKMEASFEKLRL